MFRICAIRTPVQVSCAQPESGGDGRSGRREYIRPVETPPLKWRHRQTSRRPPVPAIYVWGPPAPARCLPVHCDRGMRCPIGFRNDGLGITSSHWTRAAISALHSVPRRIRCFAPIAFTDMSSRPRRAVLGGSTAVPIEFKTRYRNCPQSDFRARRRLALRLTRVPRNPSRHRCTE
jgi:hypothetical protein